MNKFAIEQDYIIDSVGPENNGVTLPFPAPLAWWSFSRSSNPEDGVDYFGGWAMNAAEYDEGVRQYGNMPFWAEQNTALGLLRLSRHVAIAPFGARKRWMDESKGDNKKGTHLQQLVFAAAIQNDGSYVPWGPMILSLKVTAAMRFAQLIREWADKTYEARLKFAGGQKSHYFYMPVGTFGKAPVYETVGKGSKTSEVTMPFTFPYENISKEQLEKSFVGQETAVMMADFKNQAQEWLTDKKWQNGEENKDQQPADRMVDETPFSF